MSRRAKRSEIRAGDLERIFTDTVHALTRGRDRIVEMHELAFAESRRLEDRVERLKREALAAIEEVDALQAEMELARTRLFEVSRAFDTYSQVEVRDAYKEASAVQERLAAAREREMALRRERDEAERSLHTTREMVGKAEAFQAQVSVAIEVLQGNLESIGRQVEEWQQKSVVARQVIGAQEDERRRVAQEIHDGPAQSLANVVLRSEITERLVEAGRMDEMTGELGHLRTLSKAALADLRRIIFDLRPMALDDLGLVPTLRRYIDQLRQANDISLELVVLGSEGRVDRAIEVALFRFVQEAIGNALRHAHAHYVTIRVEFRKEALKVVVKDDGVGFAVEEVLRSAAERESLGLIGMRERIELLDGSLDVRSAPGKGAKLSAHVPLSEPLDAAAPTRSAETANAVAPTRSAETAESVETAAVRRGGDASQTER